MKSQNSLARARGPSQLLDLIMIGSRKLVSCLAILGLVLGAVLLVYCWAQPAQQIEFQEAADSGANGEQASGDSEAILWPDRDGNDVAGRLGLAVLEIHVWDLSGNPAPEIPVQVHIVKTLENGAGREKSGVVTPEIEGITDIDGKVSFSISPGKAGNIVVGDVGSSGIQGALARSQFSGLKPSETRRFDISLGNEKGSFWLKAVDAQSRQPLAGLMVLHGATDLGHTDRDGFFEVTPFYSTRLPSKVTLSHEQLGVAIVELSPGHESYETAREVIVSSPAALSVVLSGIPDSMTQPIVRVVPLGASSQSDLAYLSRSAHAQRSTERWMLPSWTQQMNSERVFEFRAIPSGIQIQVSVSSSGRGWQMYPDALVLDPFERRRIEWELTSRQENQLIGRVIGQDGLGLDGVELWHLSDVKWAGRATHGRVLMDPDDVQYVVGRTQSGADGLFELEYSGRFAGWVGVAPVSANSKLPSIAFEFTDREALGSESGFEVKVPRAMPVKGVVLDSTGKGLADQALFVGVEGWGGSVQAESRNDGSFSTRALPEGSFLIMAVSPGDNSSVIGPVEFPFFLSDQALIEVPLGPSISGVVRPIEGNVQVSFVSQHGTGITVVSHCNAKGEFESPSLDSGPWLVVARSDDGYVGQHGPIDLVEGGGPIEIELDLVRAGRIRIENRRGIGAVNIEVLHNGNSVFRRMLKRQETSELLAVPGNYVVSSIAEGESEPESSLLEVAGEEVRRVVLTKSD